MTLEKELRKATSSIALRVDNSRQDTKPEPARPKRNELEQHLREENRKLRSGQRWFAFDTKHGRVARQAYVPVPLAGEKLVGNRRGYLSASEAMKAK